MISRIMDYIFVYDFEEHNAMKTQLSVEKQCMIKAFLKHAKTPIDTSVTHEACDFKKLLLRRVQECCKSGINA